MSASVDLLQDITGISTALVLLPWTFGIALILSTIGLLSALRNFSIKRVNHQTSSNGTALRVLISGAGSPIALDLARLLKSHGHTVIGVDYETFPLLSPARLSRAYSRFFRLSTPRTNDKKTVSKAVRFGRFGGLIHPAVQTAMKGPSTEEMYAADISAVMQYEHISLWIPCERPSRSGTVTYKSFQRAKIAIEAAGKTCICPNDDIAALSRSFVAFAEFVNALHLPVRAPVALLMHSRDDVHRTLAKAPPGMLFALEKIHRAVEVQRTPTNSDLVLTDSRTDKTSPPRRESFDTTTDRVPVSMAARNAAFNAIAKVPISEHTPWLLKEDVAGPRLVTSAVIVNGRVRAFLAVESLAASASEAESAECQMAWKTVPQSAPLYPALQQFTQQFASYQAHIGAMHLNITFAASTAANEAGEDTRVMPLACNTNVHESMSLLMSDSRAGGALAGVYASLVPHGKAEASVSAEKTLVNGIDFGPVSALGLTELKGLRGSYVNLFLVLVVALMEFFSGGRNVTELADEAVNVLRLLLTWKDEAFEWSDPWPWWYIVHVQEPAMQVAALAARVQAKVQMVRARIS